MAITLPRLARHGGGQTTYSGTFTHTMGAAAETFALGNARVLSVHVSNLDSGAKNEFVSFTESISGGTNTVTVNKLDAVTTGRIVVLAYAGN